MNYETFTIREKRTASRTVWRRQRSYIAGDRLFNEYGKMLNEILNGLDYVPGRVV